MSSIVKKVSEFLMEHLWDESVSVFMPKSAEEFKEKVIDI